MKHPQRTGAKSSAANPDSAAATPPRKTEKNPERVLAPGQSEALLRELHLVSRDGKLHADSLRKLKQVNHLARLLTPAIEDVLARHPQAQIVDAGAGNAYLGFVLYELFLKENEAQLWSVEPRSDLVARGIDRAKKLGFSRMQFLPQTLQQAAALKPAAAHDPGAEAPAMVDTSTNSPNAPHLPNAHRTPDAALTPARLLPERLHLVTALHACDTATDDAIALALSHKADHIALVPCCQSEVAAQLKELASAPADPSSSAKRTDPLAWNSLWQHPLHRREIGAHLTNVIRALFLEANGYAVTVTELTGWEHSLKNELILARRVGGEHRGARAKLNAILEATGVRPAGLR